MYVNMDNDLLVRFHPFLVLLVPSFSHPIGGSVLSIPSQNKKRYDSPMSTGVNGDFLLIHKGYCFCTYSNCLIPSAEEESKIHK